jgi:hypothetical protein
LNKYGRDLSRDDVSAIKENFNDSSTDYSRFYIRNMEHNGVPATTGILAG